MSDTVPVHLPYLRRLLSEHLSGQHVRSIMRRVRETPEGKAKDVTTISDDMLEQAAADLARAEKRRAG